MSISQDADSIKYGKLQISGGLGHEWKSVRLKSATFFAIVILVGIGFSQLYLSVTQPKEGPASTLSLVARYIKEMA